MKSQHNESQLSEQMKKINERMYSLERKIDVLAGLLTPKAPEVKAAPKVSSPVNPSRIYAEQSHQNHHNNHNNHNNRHNERTMYTSICADCKKECSVPFKPTGDRPIYCKECFTLRKSRNTFKPKVEDKPTQAPKEVAAAQVVTPQVTAITKVPSVKAKPKKKVAQVKKVASKKPASRKAPVGKKVRGKK